MKPTVGRVVHFYEFGQGPFAALITVVYTERCCTLAVFKPHQTSVYIGSSVLMKDPTDTNSTMYWEWPPRAE